MPANTYGRQVVVPMTNKSGGSVAAGDVVVVDTTNNDAFTTSTAGSVTTGVGVAQETIANNATGRVCIGGYVSLVNVNASVTRGNYGKTYTVAKQATDAGASRVAGTFCQFLTGGTTPDAYIYQPDLGGASLTNPMTTGGDVIYGGASGTPTRLANGSSGQVLTSAGGTSAPTWSAVPAPYMAILQDQKAQNTAGGTFTSGAWQTRDLNTEVSDSGNIVTIASNHFVPISGTYHLRAWATARATDRHQARLQNTTGGGSTVQMGSTGFSSAPGDGDNVASFIDAIFTANGTDTYEIQHRAQTTSTTNGFGVPANLATEVYTSVVLTKIG